MDNDQAKMMMFMMPIMLTVFMLALPSGLVLYIFVNSLLTIVQQLVINRRIPAPT
jgi:YidC/Oxa1 family membrane protein insertase